MNEFNQSESGQALVELLFVILFCFVLGIGIFESGVLINNISIMNTAMDTTAKYAAAGAPYEKLQDVVIRESNNLLAGASLVQEISEEGLVVQVWHPEYDVKLGSYSGGGTSARPQCNQTLTPENSSTTPYLFWTEGYEIRVGVRYGIGFKLPFMEPITVESLVWGSKLIDAENDLDRDGLRDQYEVEYVQWAMAADSAGSWRHPIHRDGTGEFTTNPSTDVDGDGVSNDSLPFDYDNDEREDKLDKEDNLLEYNPLVGPDGWHSAIPCP